jgi:hypothetical protein
MGVVNLKLEWNTAKDKLFSPPLAKALDREELLSLFEQAATEIGGTLGFDIGESYRRYENLLGFGDVGELHQISFEKDKVISSGVMSFNLGFVSPTAR